MSTPSHNASLTIETLDHLVLYTQNIDDSVAFYENVLGMRKIVFGDNRIAVSFGKQKINLHPAQHPFHPHALTPVPGAADLCFITQLALDEAMQQVRDLGVEILLGPVTRNGAVGEIQSFYIRDPDGNLLEIANRIEK